MSEPSANNTTDHPPHGQRDERWLHLAAIWSALSLAALVWTLWGLTIDRSGSAEAAAANLRSIRLFWIASFSCWLGLTVLGVMLRRGERRGLVDGPNRSRRGAIVVLTVAILARLIVLITHQPSLSDDVYRYVFDGRNLAYGLNPYMTDPAARSAALASGDAENWPGERELLPLLAYPEVSTPYLPLSQYAFAGLGWICERCEWTSPAASSHVFRAAFVLIEIAMMLVLAAALRGRGLSPWWLALYAWHPLAIDGFAASGHQDVIGIFLLVAALAVASATVPHAARLWRFTAAEVRNCSLFSALLAASVMVKPLALIVVPMALKRRSVPMWALSILVGSVVCLALAAPLRWLPQQPPYVAWKATADWMAEKAAHFAGLYEPVLCVVRHEMTGGPDPRPGFNLDQEWLARKICAWTFIAIGVIVLVLAREPWRGVTATLLALTLCSTTCHPWYLLWALALFPMHGRSWALWMYSLTIPWGYIVFAAGKGHALGVEWTVPPQAIAVAYIAVGVGFIIDVTMAMRNRTRRRVTAA
jgi:hypothetical protein